MQRRWTCTSASSAASWQLTDMAELLSIDGELFDGMAGAIRQQLEASPGPVTVRLNSPGGIATEGAALYAAFERHGDVTCCVDGIAASAASLAMLGARHVVIHHAAMVMIHEPHAMTWGTAAAHQSSADLLMKATELYAETYAEATGHPVARIREWMRDETWLNAEEAVSLNFCDEIERAASSKQIAAFDYSRFQSAPAACLAISAANGWTAAPS